MSCSNCAGQTSFYKHLKGKGATYGSNKAGKTNKTKCHQCGLGLILRLRHICGLSLLLVLFSDLRSFSPGTLVFPSPQKPILPNSLDTVGVSSHHVDVHC